MRTQQIASFKDLSAESYFAMPFPLERSLRNQFYQFTDEKTFSSHRSGNIFSPLAEIDNYTNPTVETDKDDYQPSETALITASGFLPGETIEFQVLHLGSGSDGLFGTTDDKTIDTKGAGHEPWSVTDGRIIWVDIPIG